MLVWSLRSAHHPRMTLRCIYLVIVTLTAVAANGSLANAQFGGGSVIVTVPSTESDTAPAQAPAARPKKAKPKPRRRAAAKRARPRPAKPRRRRNTSADKLKIAVLVNDDPITQYEIGQRAALLAGRAGVGKQAKANFQNLIKRKSTNTRLRAILKETVEANRGRSRKHILSVFERRKQAFAAALRREAVSKARKQVLPGLRRKATQELIEERLKLQAAKQAKVLISESRLDTVMKGIAKQNKLTYKKFQAQLKRQGTDIKAMRSRVRAQMSWLRLINSKFGRFVDVNQKTIDESVGGSSDAEKVSLHLHRFVFRLPEKIDQRIIAKRMIEAEKVRTSFKACNGSRTLARGVKNVVFQDMGFQVAAAIAEPTRSLLLNARDGEMAPPVTTRDGVALYAVCARRSGAKSFEARAAAERSLREKGTAIYGRKHLADLRREAHIEYRSR